MSKKVCQGCGDTLIGSNQEELYELLKIHWDYQNPSLKKCEYCNTIIHANDDELVKKRLFEHEKICREAKRYRWKCLFQCKIITKGDCKKFFLTTNNNEPDPNELKKHLNENHEKILMLYVTTTINLSSIIIAYFQWVIF